MSAATPVSLANLPVPPAPGNRDPGGGQLFSYGGQPYWLDSQGNLWALTTSGTSASWSQAAFTGGGGGGFSLTRTAVQTGNFTAAANTIVPCDTTSGPLTVTLPNAPAAGTLVIVKMVTQGGTNAVTVNCAGSDVFNKAGGGTSGTLKLSSQGMFMDYNGAGIWTVLADDLPLSQLDLRYLNLAGGGAVAGALSTTPVVLTDAATILVNAALSDFFRVTLGGSRTLGTPTNPTDGQLVTFEVIQPASGGPWTLSYSAAYSFPASIPQPTLSTAANSHDFITFAYNSGTALWTCTGYVSAQNSGLVTIAQGGTGQTTATAAYNALSPMLTLGDLEYESATNTASRLAGNTSATKNFLTQTGTGTVSAAPAWGTIAAGDVPYDSTTSHIHLPGTQAAGANSQVTDSGHVHPATGIIPSDHGLLAWSFDITGCGNGTTLIAGTVYLVKIPIRYALTATNLWFSATSAGVGASTGSFVGLYSSAGSLLTGSSDLGTAIAAGNHQVTLTTPQALSAGTFVWAAILVNQATTQPGLLSPINFASSVAQNLGLTAATFRIAVPSGGTAQTTLPGSFTPSSNTNTGAEFLWFGIS